ncbi:hypothetical protein [Candidatus Paracaedibacter symbiosus]|uniref:hypothetical protein n=1 Tax=Candidatus Paracaedibacter symbiosus TaxID=244582 RepID=UPI001E388024|nr:hypothetical protein [Candidatus Paracaedibacter symbiosus]
MLPILWQMNMASNSEQTFAYGEERLTLMKNTLLTFVILLTFWVKSSTFAAELVLLKPTEPDYFAFN